MSLKGDIARIVLKSIENEYTASTAADIILDLIDKETCKPNPFYQAFNASARDECHKCGRPRGVCSC